MNKKKNQHGKIPAGSWIWHTRELLNSLAWRTRSKACAYILDRVELELCNHGGTDNGKLPVTYDDFERYGIHRQAIRPAIREGEALGLIEITQRGHAGNADHRQPNLFRLTYLPTGDKPATNEWRRITTMEEAKAIAVKARANKPTGYNRQRRKRGKFHSTENAKPSGGIRTTKPDFSVVESVLQNPKPQQIP